MFEKEGAPALERVLKAMRSKFFRGIANRLPRLIYIASKARRVTVSDAESKIVASALVSFWLQAGK